METLRCPTCLAVLPVPDLRRCPACHEALQRRRPIVLGARNRARAGNVYRLPAPRR